MGDLVGMENLGDALEFTLFGDCCYAGIEDLEGGSGFERGVQEAVGRVGKKDAVSFGSICVLRYAYCRPVFLKMIILRLNHYIAVLLVVVLLSKFALIPRADG